MSDDPRVAYLLDWDPATRDGGEPTLVDFPGARDAVGLVPAWPLRIPESVTFRAPVRERAELDYPCTNVRWPILSERMMAILEALGTFAHRRIAVTMTDARGAELEARFVAVQLLAHAGRLDRTHSRAQTDPDYPDEVSRVELWRIEVPVGGLPPLFRVEESAVNLFVSAEARRALEAAGIRGAIFRDLDEISDKRWVAGAPPADALPASTGADSSDARPTVTEEPLTKEDLEQLSYDMQTASELLQVTPDEADEAVGKIREEVDRYLAAGEPPDGLSFDDYFMGLAALWGECLVEAAGWKYVRLRSSVDPKPVLAVVSPDRSHAVDPFHFFRRLLEDRRDNTSKLLYNMIKAGELPHADEGSYSMLG